MKYRFMNEHRHDWSLTTMCRLLQVALPASINGYIAPSQTTPKKMPDCWV